MQKVIEQLAEDLVLAQESGSSLLVKNVVQGAWMAAKEHGLDCDDVIKAVKRRAREMVAPSSSIPL